MKKENLLNEGKSITKSVSKTEKTSGNSEEVKDRKGIKKNQLIIGALTLMLGIVGYINLRSSAVDLSEKDTAGTEAAFAESELYNEAGEYVDDELLSEDDTDTDDTDITLNSSENNIGEAVLTNATAVTNNVADIKLNREQIRSKSKEYYLDIINSDDMDNEAINEAKDAYLKLTEDMEKEAEAETLLVAKGFVNPIVSIGDQTVDVVIEKDSLSDEEKAKIEDIIIRKTGCTIDKIVITTYAK